MIPVETISPRSCLHGCQLTAPSKGDCATCPYSSSFGFEYSPVVHISEPPLPRKDKRRKSTEKQNWKAIQQEHGRKP